MRLFLVRVVVLALDELRKMVWELSMVILGVIEIFHDELVVVEEHWECNCQSSYVSLPRAESLVVCASLSEIKESLLSVR